MSRQTRSIYSTGNAELDRILNDIAARLDVIEGLRPDSEAGYYKLDENKNIATEEPLEGYQPIVDGVTIEDNKIEVENGIIKLTIGAAAGSIEVYDADGNLIHKLE